MYFVVFFNKVLFGRKIIAPKRAIIIETIAMARAGILFIIREARKMFVNDPKSAPTIKGMAFFRLIIRETANGTNKPIVTLEENTIAVRIAPIK